LKTCMGCGYAEWKKTKTGRLHPSGEGKCTYKYNAPALPNSMHFMGNRQPPEPMGGWIDRKHVYETHCPYWCPANPSLQGTGHLVDRTLQGVVGTPNRKGET